MSGDRSGIRVEKETDISVRSSTDGDDEDDDENSDYMELEGQWMGKHRMTPMTVAVLYVVSNLDKSPNGQDYQNEDSVSIAAERLGITDHHQRFVARELVRKLRFEPDDKLSKLGARLVRGSHELKIRNEFDRLMQARGFHEQGIRNQLDRLMEKVKSAP